MTRIFTDGTQDPLTKQVHQIFLSSCQSCKSCNPVKKFLNQIYNTVHMNGMLASSQLQACNDPAKKPPDFLSVYEKLLDQRNVQPKAKPYFLRWAKIWSTTDHSGSPSGTIGFFEALGRRPNLPAWQFQEAVQAVTWLARDVLHIPWAE